MDDHADGTPRDQTVTQNRGRTLLRLWVLTGTASAVLLWLNLADDGWDAGAASNVAMLVASVSGVVLERRRARRRPPS